MSKYIGPKCKLCRREGEKLFLKADRCASAKCGLIKKNYPPGIHGPKGRPRQSGYNMQLREKQKAKRIYGLLEKQFKLSFERAMQQKGDAGENLLKILETRLDNVIYKLGIANSRSEGRVLVSYGHFKVNDKIINIPSYNVRPGDIIKINEASRNIKMFSNLSEKLKTRETPGWLNFDIKNFSAKALHEPKKDSFEMIIRPQMIIEFYSR